MEPCSVIDCPHWAEWEVGDEKPYSEAYACPDHLGEVQSWFVAPWTEPA